MGLLIPGVQCLGCKHIRGVVQTRPMVDGVEADCGFACAAFPKGIPDEIAEDEFDHRQPFPDDQGIRWEPLKPGAIHPQDGATGSLNYS